MFKWLSKIFGGKPTPTTPLPPKPSALQERIVTTADVQSRGRSTRRPTPVQSVTRSSIADDTHRRRDDYTDNSLLNPLNPLNPISPIYAGNSYADTPSPSYSDRSETCSPSYSSSYDSGSSSSSYDSGSSSSDSGGSCGGGSD